tara:strand:- start:404 stop:685 length:282 start_codon:yes stop_codon:yes gene_type:complete
MNLTQRIQSSLTNDCIQTKESSELSNEKILHKVIGSASIIEIIKKGVIDSPEKPWMVMDIHEVIYEELKINLSLERVDLFNILIDHFNGFDEE